jgi:hypothetical protein
MRPDEFITRAVLPNLKDFKQFWKEKGPFKFALTSSEFPPILMEAEEWIFASRIKILLKELMQFEKRKMKFVKSPFNPENKSILRPEALSSWRITNFPEEWNASVCDLFVPEGHLTKIVFAKISTPADQLTPEQVEDLFFKGLAKQIDVLGYGLFSPRASVKYADIRKYLEEWEKDEQEAGLL